MPLKQNPPNVWLSESQGPTKALYMHDLLYLKVNESRNIKQVTICSYRPKMSDGDGKANCQRETAAKVCPLAITGGEHRQHQHHGYYKLDSETLSRSNPGVEGGRSQAANHGGWRKRLQNSGASDGAKALGDYEKDGANETDTPRYEHGTCDGWVNVATAYVANDPYAGGDAEAE